jgi:threonine aldolase
MNYLSDTVTLPTDEMMRSIQNAHLGDDVYGQDTTVNVLEQKAASMMNMEAACFMPSGTMANLASIMAHCPRGSKVLVGNESDIYIYEAGGASVCGGIMYEPIPTQANGELAIGDLEKAFPVDVEDPQFALPALICLENTHNRCGGKVLSDSYLREVYEFSREKNVPIHMDGARIFNASIASGVDVKEITKYADSIQFCLSKGLSAPVGSIVAGSHEHIKKVRTLRKMLGGGMRQVGIIAAPAIIALETMIGRLSEDHARARDLAMGLSSIPGITLESKEIESNIIMFKVDPNLYSWQEFLNVTSEKGIVFSEMGYGRLRAVVHRHITDEDIFKTVESVKEIMTRSLIMK